MTLQIFETGATLRCRGLKFDMIRDLREIVSFL
jgi:hypothetical protein